MKAARLVGPHRFEFEDVEMPTPKDGEALVKMEYFSVCGSDLRAYDRTLPEEQYPLNPGAPCHENVGIVQESRDPSLKPGQRVIALQSGGLLEYAAVRARNLVPVPDSDFDPAMWVLCQPVGTVLYAVQQIGTLLGARVVIFGQGPIGLSFTDLIVRGGARQVIVVDLLDYRLDTARKLGATHTINASRENVLERINEITGGKMADIAVDAVGRAEVAHNVFQALRMQGTALIFGIAHDEDVFEFNWTAMTRQAASHHRHEQRPLRRHARHRRHHRRPREPGPPFRRPPPHPPHGLGRSRPRLRDLLGQARELPEGRDEHVAGLSPLCR